METMEALRFAIHSTMMKTLIFLLFITVSTSEEEGYKPNTKCVEEDNHGHLEKLFCKQAFLDDIKTMQLTVNIKMLYCEQCNVKTLTKNIFANEKYKTLEILNLTNSQINAIDEDFFYFLPNLKYIYLQGNNIHYLPPKIFEKSFELLHLDLSKNNLIGVKEQFKKFTKLEILLLNDNKITNISENAFSDSTQIKILDLSGNQLTHIPNNLLTNLKLLTDFKFSNNILKKLPSNLVSDLKNLERIDFSYNSIVNITNDIFVHVPNLKTIKFNNNNISFIEEDSFQKLKNLEEVDLSNNDLTTLKREIFVGLNKLKFINLFNNNLTEIVLPKLNILYLNLSNNHMETFSNNTFLDTAAIQQIDISKNPIKFFSKKLFDPLHNLKNITLDASTLSKVDYRLWLQDLMNVTIIINNDIWNCKKVELLQWFAKAKKIRIVWLDSKNCLNTPPNISISTTTNNATINENRTGIVDGNKQDKVAIQATVGANSSSHDNANTTISISEQSHNKKNKGNDNYLNDTHLTTFKAMSTTSTTTTDSPNTTTSFITTTTTTTTTKKTTTTVTPTTTTQKTTTDKYLIKIFDELEELKTYNEGNIIIQVVLLIFLFIILVLLVGLILVLRKRSDGNDGKNMGYVDDSHLELLAS